MYGRTEKEFMAKATNQSEKGQYFTPDVIADRLVYDLSELSPSPITEVHDLGCGPGALSAAVQKHNPHSRIVGYDTDNLALEVFNNRFSDHEDIHSKNQNLLLEPLDENSIPRIISNPPYLLSRRLGRKMTQNLRASGLFSVTSGKLNTFSLFIQVALRALSPGGVAAFVVPIGVANLDDHLPLRKLLLESCDKVRVTWCTDHIYFAEQGVSVDVLLLSFRKRKKHSEETALEIVEWNGREEKWKHELNRVDLPQVFPTKALLEAEEQSGVPITKEFEIVARGFNWKKGWETFRKENASGWKERLHPIVKGSDIGPEGKLRDDLLEINYAMLKEHAYLSRTCDFDLHSSNRPRLLLADITSKIKVVFTTEPILPMNSVKVIFHKTDSEERLHCLMHFLRKKSTFKRLKLGRPNLHLTKGNLETLLVPEGDL